MASSASSIATTPGSGTCGWGSVLGVNSGRESGLARLVVRQFNRKGRAAARGKTRRGPRGAVVPGEEPLVSLSSIRNHRTLSEDKIAVNDAAIAVTPKTKPAASFAERHRPLLLAGALAFIVGL